MAKTSDKMLTETEAFALCIVRQLGGESFGADQAKAATETALLLQSRLTPQDFARVIARIGNHSAIRQWAVKHGFLKQSVAEDALAKEVKRLQSLESSELDSMV